METIKLRRPIAIDGREVADIDLDFDALTVGQYMEAEAKSKAKRSADASFSVAETDYGFQVYLAFYAAIAADPKLDITDLERVTGRDIYQFSAAGRNFLLGSAAEAETGSTGSSSDAPSDGTPGSSTARRTK